MDQILAEEEVDGGTDDMVQWTLTDHLNTVRDIARYDPQTGATTVVNHLVYDAFGNVTRMGSRRREPAVDSPFLFTARPFDQDSRLHNNLNRWYDPAVGRWLSEDPIGFNAGDENLYRYVGNCPVAASDSVGLGTCHATDEYYRRGRESVQAVPYSISVKLQTNPAGHPTYPLQRLLCAVSVPVIAKYKCCCNGREHVVYHDADRTGYSIEVVSGLDIIVNVQQIHIPLPPPLDKLPFGPSLIAAMTYCDKYDQGKAESFCFAMRTALWHKSTIYPTTIDCPFHGYVFRGREL